MSDNEEFESTESGASATYPQQCSALRKNGFVVIKGKACKIVEMTTSKTGKHGHAKVHMVGLDIFSGKKCEDICPSTHNMDVPNVKRQEFTVIDVGGDGFLSLMDDSGETRDDLAIKDGICNVDLNGCQSMFDETEKNADSQQLVASVIQAMGMCEIKEIKVKGLSS